VKAELSFRHQKVAPITVPLALLMDRHTQDRRDVTTDVFPSLRTGKTIEIVLVGQSSDYMWCRTLTNPLTDSADETELVLGIWTCDVRVTAGYDHEGVPSKLTLDSRWAVKVSPGHPVDIKLLRTDTASEPNDGLFVRPYSWSGQNAYRCSICEVDSLDRTVVEEHTRLTHGFAVGEDRASSALNLLIANASGMSPLSGCKVTLVQFRKWDQTLKQFHEVYEMREFRPVGLHGNYSPIYVGKPAVFQFVDAVDPAAPIIRAVVGLRNAVNWVVPSPGIWRADFEVQFGGKSPARFYKCLEWDGRSNPKFVLCP
jgi:hypothetical protein